MSGNTELMQQLMLNGQMDGLAPSAPSDKSLLSDFNVRNTSIAYIVLALMVSMGMNPLESQMTNIANDQNIQNTLNTDIIQFNSLITQIENGASAGGTTNAAQIATQLQAAFQKIFGANAQMVDGNIVPSQGSDLYNFMQMLQKSGQNPQSNPVYGLINSFAKQLYAAPPTNSQTSYNTLPQNSLAFDLSGGNGNNILDAENWVNVMGSNYYYSNNPTNGKISSPNYAQQDYTSMQGIQGGLSGMGQANTAFMQTATTQIGSYDQIGQSIISSINQLTQAINQAMIPSG